MAPERGTRGYATVGAGSERDDTADDDDAAALLECESAPLGAAAAARGRRRGCCTIRQRRNKLSLLATVGGGIAYAQRAGLAVAIVRLQSVYGWDKLMQGQVSSQQPVLE